MSLVRGFTDILTPHNWLPNSNLYKGGGETTTYNLGSPTATWEYKIAEGWYFITPSGVTVSNITVVKGADKSFTVSGHVDTKGDNYYTFILRNKLSKGLEVYGRTYTYSWRIGSYTNVTDCYMGANINAQTTHYSTGLKLGHCVQVKSYGSSSGYYYPGIYVATDSGVDFSIKVYSFAVYLGAYTNPPHFESLDVQSTNVFSYMDGTNLTLNEGNLKLPTDPYFHMSCKDVTSVTTNVSDISGWGFNLKATNNYVSLLSGHQGLHSDNTIGILDNVGGQTVIPMSGFSGFTFIVGFYLRNYTFGYELDMIRLLGNGIVCMQMSIKTNGAIAFTSRATSTDTAKGMASTGAGLVNDKYFEIALKSDLPGKAGRMYSAGKYFYGQTKAYNSNTSSWSNGHILLNLWNMDLVKLKLFSRPLSDIEIFTEYVIGSK